MALFKQSSFTVTGIHSLRWRGDELVDWVGGGHAFALDATERSTSVYCGYHVDAATALPDGRFAVIYERLCTKGLPLHNGPHRSVSPRPCRSSALFRECMLGRGELGLPGAVSRLSDADDHYKGAGHKLHKSIFGKA
jgi:hypothetical protein